MRIQPLIKECRSVQTGTSLKVNFQILIGMCPKAHRGYKNDTNKELSHCRIRIEYQP